jgi:hypothetical protein
MDEYDWTNKREIFKKGHRWMQMLDAVELGLQKNLGERYAVRSSMGCGGWAKVPWLAVSDPSETTQHGLYLQYLFRADMSAVYLCLGQGASPPSCTAPHVLAACEPHAQAACTRRMHKPRARRMNAACTSRMHTPHARAACTPRASRMHPPQQAAWRHASHSRLSAHWHRPTRGSGGVQVRRCSKRRSAQWRPRSTWTTCASTCAPRYIDALSATAPPPPHLRRCRTAAAGLLPPACRHMTAA